MTNDVKAPRRAPAKKAPAAKAAAAPAPTKTARPRRTAQKAAALEPQLRAAGVQFAPTVGAVATWDGEQWIAAPADDAEVTEGGPVATDRPEGLPDDAILFMGRWVEVSPPDAGQIAIWQRTAHKITLMQRSGTNMNEAIAPMLGRIVGVLSSVLVDLIDREWIEDLLLERKAKIEEVGQLITLTVDHFAAKKQTKAPTTGPTPKARRR